MQGSEIVRQLDAETGAHPERNIIKWWRKEEDYIDFDLVEDFRRNLDASVEIEGFELIDLEHLWLAVREHCDERRLKRESRNGKWVLIWEPPEDAEDVEGPGIAREYPYTAQMLLKILDAETRDNYVD